MGGATTHAVCSLQSDMRTHWSRSHEVDFALKLLHVTYVQVPWQGNQLRLSIIKPFLAMFIGCASIQTTESLSSGVVDMD